MSIALPPSGVMRDDPTAQSRSNQDRWRDEPVSVASFQLAGATDDTAAFQAAINTGRPVKVPYRATPYLLSNWINLATGSEIFGQGRPTIKVKDGAQGRIFRAASVSRIRIRGLIFDGNKTNVSTARGVLYFQDASDVVIEDCEIINASGNNTFWSATPGACSQIRIERCRFADNAGTAVDFFGTVKSQVLFCEFEDNVGFGVRVYGGASHNLFQGNWCMANGIELIGIVYDSHDNRVIGNHAQGTGDNGISITGWRNTAVGNVCYGNRYTGLYLYGHHNTATANVCVANGQCHNPSSPYYDAANVNGYAGITVGGLWGGTGQNNVVTGNFCDDDQTTATQFYGIRLLGASYANWAASTSYAAGTYLKQGLNVYTNATGGTSGTTAPTHTSGSVSDGGISWTYVDTFAGSTSEAYGNVVSGNRVLRFASGGAAVSDGTQNHNNHILADDHLEFFGSGGLNTVTAGFQRRASIWTNGQAVVYGAIRYSDAANVVYRCTTVGGTCSTKPSHTTIGQIVTGADGIGWVAIGTQQLFPAMAINTGDVRFSSVIHIPVTETGTATVQDFAGNGTPEGKVTAPVGSTYRRADGSAGATYYVKESGTGATGWVAK